MWRNESLELPRTISIFGEEARKTGRKCHDFNVRIVEGEQLGLALSKIWWLGSQRSETTDWQLLPSMVRLIVMEVSNQHPMPRQTTPAQCLPSDYIENCAVLSVCHQAAKSPELSFSSCCKHGWESNIIWNAIILNCQHNYQENSDELTDRKWEKPSDHCFGKTWLQTKTAGHFQAQDHAKEPKHKVMTL